MRCRRARRATVEWGLGLLPADEIAELRLHLERCARCSSESVAEARLVTDLAALGQLLPPEVDVVPRLGLEPGGRRALERAEVSSRQLGWLSAAALAGAVLLAFGLVLALPSVPRVEELAREAAAALVAGWDRVAPALVTLALLPLKLLGALISWVSVHSAPLGRIAATARSGALFACGLMSLTIALVVARDLARGTTAPQRKEHEP